MPVAHSDQQDHFAGRRGIGREGISLAPPLGKRFRENGRESGAHPIHGLDSLAPHLLAQAIEQERSRGGTDVGTEQDRLQIVVEILVDLRALLQDLLQSARHDILGFAEAILDFAEQ